MSNKVFSFDAETNGLWGCAFAIGAVVYTDGEITSKFISYLGPDVVTDSWVRENVLPSLSKLKKTHNSYGEMLGSFAGFYKEHKDGADIIAHMGIPVESKIIMDMHTHGYIGDWDGPYPFLDVAGMLKVKGFDPTSVDNYNKKFDLLANCFDVEYLTPHNPLYDSVAAAVCYYHLLSTNR